MAALAIGASGVIAWWERGRWKITASALLVLMHLSVGGPAGAADAELQRLLMDNRCASPRITAEQQSGELTLYRVNCGQSGHKVLMIECSAHRCTLRETSVQRDEESN